jgi:hypothetical protein
MPIDIFQSRRNYNERCQWWSRNEDDKYADDRLIMKRVPTGTFMAREISPQQLQNSVFGGEFMLEKNTITIKSPDNLEGIKANDLVEYLDEKWIVANVQKSKARIQNTAYAKNSKCSHYWYIELRK